MIQELLSKQGVEKMSDIKGVDVGLEACIMLDNDGDGSGVCLNNWTDTYKDISLLDACLATSAAPTYFKGHQMKIEGKDLILVDGGICMNNPVMVGHAHATALVDNPKEELFMVSLSTGYQISGIKGRDNYKASGGLLDLGRWGINGVNYCMNSLAR